MGCEEVDYSTELKDFSAEGLPSGFLHLDGQLANQSLLNSVELWSDANMHFLPTLELIKE